MGPRDRLIDPGEGNEVYVVRILHSADWQIGLRAQHVAMVGDTVREARMEAARRCIEAANRERVDAVILAGDTFEDNFVDDRLVHGVVDVLAASRAPVYVLPGNHDALSKESVYCRGSWLNRPAHVALLESSTPVQVPRTDAVLLPAPLLQKKGFTDPTKALVADFEGMISIGVAHGSLRIEGHYSADDFPIALDAARRSKLDYLALGHWHGHYVHEGATAYSGTHETTRFGESRSGQALVVEIAARGSAPVLREHRTGVLSWETCEVDLTAGVSSATAQILSFIADLHDPGHTLLRLKVRGTSSDDAGPALSKLQDELGARLLHLVVEREDIPDRVAEGHLSEIARKSGLVAGLLDDLGCSGAVAAPAKISPDKAQAGRRLLAELVLEVWS